MHTLLNTKYFGFVVNCVYHIRASPIFWDYESKKLKLDKCKQRRLEVRVLIFLNAVSTAFVIVNLIHKIQTGRTRLQETHLLFVPLLFITCAAYQIALIEILDAYWCIVEVFNEAMSLHTCLHGTKHLMHLSDRINLYFLHFRKIV